MRLGVFALPARCTCLLASETCRGGGDRGGIVISLAHLIKARAGPGDRERNDRGELVLMLGIGRIIQPETCYT